MKRTSKTTSRKMRIGIVFDSGDVSCKDKYDSISDQGVMDEISPVKACLEKLGHKVVLIPIGRRFRKFDREKIISRFISDIKKSRPDAVFNLCATFCGDAKLQTLVTYVLDGMKIPYTGSHSNALDLTTDKRKTKEILKNRGVPTPRFRIFNSAKEICTKGMKFPLIVKPNFEDGSVGIEADSVVHTKKQLMKKVAQVVEKYRQPALIEEYIDGRELNVAVFINNGSTEVLPISEIVFRNFPEGVPRITSYTAKWMENSEEYKNTVGVCPAQIPEDVQERIKSLASECINAAGCRDYARVDMRLDSNNQPYVIEVNANPDISPGAGFMRSFSASGRTYDDFVRSVLEWTLQRKG
ncbi:MAG: ATP-grasp domain-containing protein [Candidatus Aenigmarchaeota archaeon]|nr:ATP-grasp domain-containing protein [Candidatus Aenigmarchaeota archaeon]